MLDNITLILSILSIIIAVLSLITSIYYNSETNRRENERREEEKDSLRKDKIRNRPQFKAISFESNFQIPGYAKDDSLDFDVLFLPYDNLDCDISNFTPLYNKDGSTPNIKGKYDKKRPICTYIDIYDKRDEWVNYVIEFENIGKSNIAFYYLLNLQDNYGSIVDLKNDFNYQTLNQYQCCLHVITPEKSNNKQGDKVRVRINYHKDYVLFNPISCSFAFNMRTDEGECWQQGIFFSDKEESQSYPIDSMEFSNYYRGDYLNAVLYDKIYWSKSNDK